MYTTRLLALIGLTLFAQSALANTIWLKDRQGNVCYNSGSSNPDHIIGYGGINREGAVGFTLTLSNPGTTGDGAVTPASADCLAIPRTTTNLVFTGGNVVRNVVPITLVKAGTGGNNECLDQGLNLSGVTGGASAGALTLAFSFTGAAGCPHPNYQAPNPVVPTYQGPFQRTVSIATGSGLFLTTLYTGAYHISTQTNPNQVPEPSSILLILAGVSSLGLLALLRRKAPAA
jgi:hypothetical protein